MTYPSVFVVVGFVLFCFLFLFFQQEISKYGFHFLQKISQEHGSVSSFTINYNVGNAKKIVIEFVFRDKSSKLVPFSTKMMHENWYRFKQSLPIQTKCH